MPEEVDAAEGALASRLAPSGWLGVPSHALESLVRFLNPWPEYAVPIDDLAEMLKKRYSQMGKQHAPTEGLAELLDQHRRSQADQARGLPAEEWRS